MISTIQRLHEALGGPAMGDSQVVNFAVEAIKNQDHLWEEARIDNARIQDLHSGLGLADARIRDLLSVHDELRNCLDISTGVETDLRDYVEQLLVKNDKRREFLKIIGTIARGVYLTPRHRCAVVSRLVDYFLDGHYDD